VREMQKQQVLRLVRVLDAWLRVQDWLRPIQDGRLDIEDCVAQQRLQLERVRDQGARIGNYDQRVQDTREPQHLPPVYVRDSERGFRISSQL